MTTARTPRFGKSTYQKAEPLPAGKRLGRKYVPDIPPGKFKDVPGQAGGVGRSRAAVTHGDPAVAVRTGVTSGDVIMSSWAHG